MSVQVGDVIRERWELAEIVGRGGHSVIYRARDRETGAEVAVKVLHQVAAESPELSIRLVREHRILGRLAGSAAVQVHRLTSTPDGVLCLVMELLRGEDLDEGLARLERTGERLSVNRLIELLDPIVETLDLAHDHDIVHRDLKPGNIFVLERSGAGEVPVRLLDFGLAKLGSASPLTSAEMVIGSPSYIAPEVWQGNGAKADHRMDVYSLGAIVFRALGGRVPFEGDSLRAKVQQVIHAPRPSLRALRPDLPEEIDSWVAQSLAVDPARRFSRAGALWTALGAVLAAG